MAHHDEAGHHGHHINSKKSLIVVFGALVGLTILTVATAQVDLGVLNVPLALTIAVVKATLVVLIFMALKYDNRVNGLVLAIGAIFVVVFLTFTLFDTAFRGDLSNVDAQTISDIERADAAAEAAAAARTEAAPSGGAEAAPQE